MTLTKTKSIIVKTNIPATITSSDRVIMLNTPYPNKEPINKVFIKGLKALKNKLWELTKQLKKF